MQTIRGTKDILPNEIQQWQSLYIAALKLLTLHNYHEIRTPIIEPTELFIKSVGNQTDIIKKEMYSFYDQGKRNITLRPEGTAAIARAYISNKLYNNNSLQKLWYMGPMFRYERPQSGRQRQFHQLGIEYIGNNNALADVEVINIANNLLKRLKYSNFRIELNSLGTQIERNKYKEDLVNYLIKYQKDLDPDSQTRLKNNPLRILDSKNIKTQAILENSPRLNTYLTPESLKHFDKVCKHLNILNIPFILNTKLVRGLDYYNHTAFEIIDNTLGNQTTLCGGGRYNQLIEHLGGPESPGVGWAIGIERLFLSINNLQTNQLNRFYIITQGLEAEQKAWHLINQLEANNINFNINFSNQSFQKQIKKAIQANSKACLIIGTNEIQNQSITIKWLQEHYQETIQYNNLINYLQTKN